MPFNLLLLPLLGGYLFINSFNRTKFLVERKDGYHFLFETSLAGVFLLAVSKALILCLQSQLTFVDIEWHKVLDYPGSGVAALSFLLAIFLPYALNFFFSLDQELDRAIRLRGKIFERILNNALHKQETVLVETRSGQVFVGVVTEVGFLTENSSVTLFLLSEGYLDTNNKQIRITRDYEPAYLRIEKDYSPDEAVQKISEYRIEISVSDIGSIRLFNKQSEQRYFGATSSLLTDESKPLI